tara:strand:+ start:782 stop:1252 length:471 start_codon:yes stop_codon:yes gene_type:complete
MRKGFLAIWMVWLAWSCQEIKDCELVTSTDFAIVGFFMADTSEQLAKTVAFSLIREESVDNFYISSTQDTIDDDTTEVVGLFLNPVAESVTYIFETDSINYDLTMEYTEHLRIYYDECDPVYSYKLDTVYSSTFDSVAIANRALDKIVPGNVEIYF